MLSFQDIVNIFSARNLSHNQPVAMTSNGDAIPATADSLAIRVATESAREEDLVRISLFNTPTETPQTSEDISVNLSAQDRAEEERDYSANHISCNRIRQYIHKQYQLRYYYLGKCLYKYRCLLYKHYFLQRLYSTPDVYPSCCC